MLIDAQRLLRELAQRKTALTQDTFHSPPADYAGFMRAVGKYTEILELEQAVQDLAREKD